MTATSSPSLPMRSNSSLISSPSFGVEAASSSTSSATLSEGE